VIYNSRIVIQGDELRGKIHIPTSVRRKITTKDICAYFTAIVICLGTLVWVLELWKADLRVPFCYDGDANLNAIWIKGIIDNGWYLQNNYLGTPFGQVLYDYPFLNNLDFIVLKLISIFTADYALVMNLFFLMTFPLTMLSTMYVFRHFKVSYPLSILGGLLFAFTPYHFFRGEAHLWLASYFMLPLMVMVIFWVYRGEPIFFKYNALTDKMELDLINSKSLASLTIAFLISFTYMYYPFFSCFFLLIAGISSYTSQRSKHCLIRSFILIAVIVLGIIISLSPSIIYQDIHGKNPEAAIRSPLETEYFGLKIVQLLMPIPGHRIPFLAEITNKYISFAPLVNENQSSSLGLIGSLGFLLLIIWVLFRNTNIVAVIPAEIRTYLDGLGLFNISAVLLATIGGFGGVFALLVTPQFRCYNRISIFIAFFSIFAMVLILESLSKKFANTQKRKIIFYALICLILPLGILDQTSPSFIPSYDKIKADYYDDEQFIREIETVMPKDAMIFQLPYVPFPEHPPVYRMTDYEHIKGYLHSHHLRWSYGAMKGRDADQWQEAVVNKPVDEMIFLLSTAGFNGIYIDSYGYEDGGSHLISTVSNILGTSPIISNNSRLYFFDMTEYNQQMQTSKMTQQDIHLAMNGWHGLENWAEIPTQWMTDKATLLIYSSTDHNATINFQVVSFHRPRTLDIYANDQFVQQTTVPTSFVSVSIPIQLYKGENIIRLHVPEGAERPCDIPELNNRDTRWLSVAVQNVTITEAS